MRGASEMGPKILIADDAMFMRRVIRKALSEGGYENIAEASDGNEVLDQYRAYRPDLVFLDITMPGRTGLEVLEELLREDENAKVVMCSAIGQETVIAQAVRMGASDFITKPFRTEDLLKLVRMYV